jgi:predicted transcriptional regulator
MVSDYERGRRKISSEMAKRFSSVLHINEAHLNYGSEQRALTKGLPDSGL